MVCCVPNVDARKLLSMTMVLVNVKAADLQKALITFFISFNDNGLGHIHTIARACHHTDGNLLSVWD